ncbi:hypothetical protein GCM10009077_11070 [Roseibium denhamense]
MSFDIFEEAPLRIDFFNNAPDVRPQVAGIVFAFSLSGKGEWLAGISASDEMNLSTPRSTVEGGNIVPQRRWIQGLVFHPRHEGACSEGFPLDVTNSSISGFCDMEAELQTSNACAERKSVDCMSGKRAVMFGMKSHTLISAVDAHADRCWADQ